MIALENGISKYGAKWEKNDTVKEKKIMIYHERMKANIPS